MKCAACGYEYREGGRWIDRVVRYKTGKHKGEIKSVDKEWLQLNVGHEPFRELTFGKGVEWLEYKEDYDTQRAYLYACPECNTVRIDG